MKSLTGNRKPATCNGFYYSYRNATIGFNFAAFMAG